MKKVIVFVLLTLVAIFTVSGCRNDGIHATIDVASALNFRCDVNMSTEKDEFTLGENDATYLFKQCFDYKNKASRIKGSEVAVTTEYTKIHFVGDIVDNAPIINGKADYSGFAIFSNNVVRFEYDNKSEYYQFENGFYNFINTYIIVFAER